MNYKVGALAFFLLLLPVLAADLTVVIGKVETKAPVVQGEYFTLMITYTIVNSKTTNLTVDSLKLDLELPDTITGTTTMNLPNVFVAEGSSVTRQAVVQNLKAIGNGPNQQIKVNIRAEGYTDATATTSLSFDISQTTSFSLDFYPERPAVGQWITVTGDIWPVTTLFVGEDEAGNEVLVQNRTTGGTYYPRTVMIITPWGTYKTLSNFKGTFSTYIPVLREGDHPIMATLDDGKTATKVLHVRGFGVTLEAVPSEAVVGQTVTIIGRIENQQWTKVPVKVTIGRDERALMTDMYGVFQTTFVPDAAGNVTITAVVNAGGKYASEELCLAVVKEPGAADDALQITASLPHNVLAGTTVVLTGTVLRQDLVPAVLTISTPYATQAVNATSGTYTYAFVAPQEPGLYTLAISATDADGTNSKEVTLRVVPFSESIIEIHPDKAQYLPGDNATIHYSIDLTQGIKTDAALRVKWYGKAIYEETVPFSKDVNGTIELSLQPGDYEVEIECLGNVKTARFQAFTTPNSQARAPVSDDGTSVEGVLSSRLTLPLIIGAIIVAAIVLI